MMRCNHLPAFLRLTTYFFLLSILCSHLLCHYSPVVFWPLVFMRILSIFVGGGVTKAFGCSPRQMALGLVEELEWTFAEIHFVK